MKSISNKKFDKKPRDLYRTWQKRPNKALTNFLPDNKIYSWVEPCAGAGDIAKWMAILKPNMRCIAQYDIEPLDPHVQKSDFLDVVFKDSQKPDYIITNPPFSQDMKKTCFAVLEKSLKDAKIGVWLLLPANWICNDDFRKYMRLCKMVVPIGRIKWEEGSEHSESKDCMWYYFEAGNSQATKLMPLMSNLLKKNDKMITEGIV